MNFSVPCHIFARMALGVLPKDAIDGSPDFPALRSVRLEHWAGHTVIVTSNRNFLSCEFLGKTDQPDGYLNIDPSVADHCRAHSNDTLTINGSAAWATATAPGFFHPANASIVGDFPIWRKLVPTGPIPAKSNGALALDAASLELLGKLSPSGLFVLPDRYDIDKPVLVRDIKDPDWFGLFLSLEHRNQSFKPATTPEWFKP